MEIWKCLTILSVTTLLILIGSKVIYKDDYAVITGTMNINQSSDSKTVLTGSASVNYPDGFNKDNCVVISLGVQQEQYRTASDKYYSFGTYKINEMSFPARRFDMGKSVIFDTNSILIDVYGVFNQNAGSDSYLARYKLVLMKI